MSVKSSVWLTFVGTLGVTAGAWAQTVAGVTVTPASGLVTTEAGGTATFTVVLDSQPGADVIISLSSSDTTEGTVSPASLTFTPANSSTPQVVTVTGVDDGVMDGDVLYTVITAPAVSADPDYDGMNPEDVTVTNIDNDGAGSAGITVDPISGLLTMESGGTATFTVVLDTQPTGDVVIGLTSSDITEGTVSPPSVTFTSADWSAAQTVTVAGVDDAVEDGNVTYTIATAPAMSTDVNYNGWDAADVSLTNIDNDAAGITVEPTSGLVTTEAGGTATFTVVLDCAPAAEVTIDLTSSDTAEGTVSPASLIFTSADWNTPQTVTVTGVDDAVMDGDAVYTVVTAPAVSFDPAYAGTNPNDVTVTNMDNDAPGSGGITVDPISGLLTAEAGGTATFTVVLDSQPTGDVVIGLTSSDTGEGMVSSSSITFTSSDWDMARTVTVTGVDDALIDGNIAYNIVTAPAVSTDINYNGWDAADVSVTNQDDDAAGIIVNPTSGLVTTEAGGTASFTVVLTSEPTEDVTIALSSSDTTEGTVSPSSVTFTSLNWNLPQTVTVTGVADAVADGDVLYTIETAPASSTDVDYNDGYAPDVSVTNTDVPGVAWIAVEPTSGLVTTEAGGTATFTVVLNTRPNWDVTIDLTSSDSSEGTVGPISLTFTKSDWDTAQTVTVTGVDDALVDGNIAYTIVTAPATSADADYNMLDAPDVSVTNTDNEPWTITVTLPASAVEGDGILTGQGQVAIPAICEFEVAFELSSSDTTELTVPLTVTIFQGQTSASFDLTIVGDGIHRETQTVTVTALAESWTTGFADMDVIYKPITPFAGGCRASRRPGAAGPASLAFCLLVACLAIRRFPVR